MLRKKIITAILSITVILPSISIPVASVFANENDDGEYKKILTQMVTEYTPKEKEIVVDTKKETVVSDGIETSKFLCLCLQCLGWGKYRLRYRRK